MAAPTDFQTQLFLNNKYVDAKSKETLSLVNPFNGEPISAAVQVAGQEDIDLAVSYAQAAFKSGPWSTYTGAQRAVYLNKLADLIDANAHKLAALDSLCMGAPIAVAENFVVPQAAVAFRYYAGLADKIEGDSFAAEDGTYRIVRHEPLGVCAGIAPWNVPMIYVGWKIAPALAAGNTAIFKASESSPLATLYLGKLVIEAGFPPGVIQFVNGGGKTGALLASHMGIAKISFTGSTSVGKIVQKLATESNMKKVTLELGGKSAALVFEDANIPNAVAGTADGFLLNSGQMCLATSRLLVQESIATPFIEAVKARFLKAASKLGSDPLSPTTTYGPMANKAQFDRVLSYINIGKEGGALAIGGASNGNNGLFIEPTVFVNPDKNSRIYKEEIFGPVLSILTFKTEEEALELANDTNTGLSAGLYTSDLNRALRVSAKLESGNVAINSLHLPAVNVPFGGWKESGSGQELGRYGFQSYLKTKSVHIK
ncbi:putative aldehyde dehydrogenase [Leptodontidium sp. 2 PMI_412]|nr:putative aldehyde dehydrogenase [Leptodontidium sp. 2 PMI_412]